MQPKKFAFIDTLRGLASLYVVVFHLSRITAPNADPPQWLVPFVGGGGAGVMLFFIVSAFTLCLSMEARATGEAEPLINFYIRRLFRIAPLFYLWLAVYFIRDLTIFHVTHGPAEIAESALFVFNLIPGQESGYVWASWTIGVEMLFYAIFPLIFFYLRNLGTAIAFLLLAMALRVPFHALCLRAMDPAIGEVYYEYSLIYNLGVFLAGVAVYHLYKLIDPARAARYGAGHACTAMFAAGLVYLCYVGFSPERTPDVVFETAIFASLLLGLAISPTKLFVNRITQFYGKISYSVYLSHATTVYFMSPLFAKIYHHTPYKTLAFGISAALALAVITPLSYATYRFVEAPGNALGRSLIRRRTGLKAA